MNAPDYVNAVAAVVTADNTVWLLITTTAALVAGAASGWISARFRQREARQERIREEVLRWTNPILGAVEGLESRLRNIPNDGLYLALDPRHAGEKRPVDPDWAASYNYTMPSTLFLFAEYFAWIRLLQERLSFELFESQETKDRFFAATWSVTKALASWPRVGIVGKGQDAQVFALQQRAIGELVIRRDGENTRSMTFPEFLEALDSDKQFGTLLDPLCVLLEAIEPETKRWSRLEATLTALQDLELECRTLLQLEHSRKHRSTSASQAPGHHFQHPLEGARHLDASRPARVNPVRLHEVRIIRCSVRRGMAHSLPLHRPATHPDQGAPDAPTTANLSHSLPPR